MSRKEIQLRIATVKNFDNIDKLYLESFPRSERRPIDEFHTLAEVQNNFEILVAENTTNEFVGFISHWQFAHFTYIEHFATSPNFRNGGYGRLILEEFIAQIQKPLILEVELPETEMANRRIGFYERLGFKPSSLPYAQPPYEEGFPTQPMILLTYGNIDVIAENAVAQIYKDVYNS